jgi:hypothetical protein
MFRSWVVAACFAVLCGCTSSPVFPMPTVTPWAEHARDDVPWTLDAPEDWSFTLKRSLPNPDLRVGVLQTWAGSADYQGAGGAGPNSGGGASAKLGSDAVMVNVSLLWSPAHEPIDWNPDPQRPLRWARDFGSHPDAQNPGWTFHGRHLCQGRECVEVVLWYGPDASEELVEMGRRVAESVEFVPRWTDRG